MSRACWLRGALVALWGASCGGEAPTKGGGVVTAADGAPGAGDRSGSSIANARPVTRPAAATFEVPCQGEIFLGPFSFTKDPEKVQLAGKVTSVTGEQVCVGGRWIDAKGEFVAVGGLGCAEGKVPTDAAPEHEHSPGNGGSDRTPLYLAIGIAEPRPATCPKVTVSLAVR